MIDAKPPIAMPWAEPRGFLMGNVLGPCGHLIGVKTTFQRLADAWAEPVHQNGVFMPMARSAHQPLRLS